MFVENEFNARACESKPKMGAAPQGKQIRQQNNFPSNYSLLLLVRIAYSSYLLDLIH
jgi:hypothetical protein